MAPEPTSHVNRWFALKLSGAGRSVAVSVAVLAVSVVLSVSTKTWSWLPRSGGVLVLFGVLLSLRRLFRLGPQRLDEPTEPIVINGNQFNIKAMHQDIQRAGDNYAQVSGVALMIVGTLIASYSDLLLEWLFPFGGK
jgi:hypothetical protein